MMQGSRYDKTYRRIAPVFLLSQQEILSTYAPAKLMSAGYRRRDIIVTSDYVYARGDAPALLVAHADTAHRAPPDRVYFDRQAGVVWSPDGLGADDRAGVAAILLVVARMPSGGKPHVLFTADEEIGAIGASVAAADLASAGAQLHFVVELDRRGSNDSVFYDCANAEFETYVNSFGHKTAVGSFSDISVLCPGWSVAGVNLSVGYYNQHSTSEYLVLSEWEGCCARVQRMLSSMPGRRFEWVGGHVVSLAHRLALASYGRYSNAACDYDLRAWNARKQTKRPRYVVAAEQDHDPYASQAYKPTKVVVRVEGVTFTLDELREAYGGSDEDWQDWYEIYESEIRAIQKTGTIADLYELVDNTMLWLVDGEWEEGAYRPMTDDTLALTR